MMKVLINLLYISLILSVLIDFFLHHDHAAFWWIGIPGFNAIYGFIGCILIVIVSKALGHHWLQREEDYYD